MGGYRNTMRGRGDSLYQLHRIEACLAHFPRVPSVDSFSHFPEGFRVHWPAPHTLFYAVVARLTGVPAGDREALVKRLSWVTR